MQVYRHFDNGGVCEADDHHYRCVSAVIDTVFPCCSPQFEADTDYYYFNPEMDACLYIQTDGWATCCEVQGSFCACYPQS